MTNDEKVYQIIIASAATDRMVDHFEFLAKININTAQRLFDNLIKDIHSLEKMPYRNPVYDRPYVQPDKYRYLVSEKRYRIVYQVEDGTVFVDDIQDVRQSDYRDNLNPRKQP